MMARRRSSFLFLLWLSLLCAGCQRSQLVEAELRRREVAYRESVSEITRLESRNEALEREIHALRQGSTLPPEAAAQTFGLRRITLGRATGGYDLDANPGDEKLQVTVEPKDGDDHVLKTPGDIHIYVLEITPQGLKFPLCSWDFRSHEVAPYWKQGLLSTGYTFQLAWKVPPKYENLRVAVRMVLSDGRVFEADRDVKVRLLPGASYRADPALPTSPPPAQWHAPPTGIHQPTLPYPHTTPQQMTPIPNPHEPQFQPIPAFPPAPTPIPGDTLTPHRIPTTEIRQSQWTPVPLIGVAKLGRPEPLPPAPTASIPTTLSDFGVLP